MIQRFKELQTSSLHDLLLHLHLFGYVDLEYAGDISIRRFTGGYIFMAAGAFISWVFRRQQIVTLSSTEAEYVALTRHRTSANSAYRPPNW